jgi:uncharacterized protein YndB with AHSA1/START domain
MPNPRTVAAGVEPEADREIVIERLLDAPRERVFEVFTTADHLGRWWGPTGFSVTTFAFDFRVGGVWRFVMHGPDGQDYQNRLVFDVIEPPSRLLARHGGGEDLEAVHHELRISLEDEGGRTRLVWRLVFPSVAERDHVVREFHAVEGGHQTIQRLADYLASR